VQAPAWCKPLLGASPRLVQASAWCKPLLGASPCLVQAPAWCKPLLGASTKEKEQLKYLSLTGHTHQPNTENKK
jgi:hypothetical protein